MNSNLVRIKSPNFLQKLSRYVDKKPKSKKEPISGLLFSCRGEGSTCIQKEQNPHII